MRIFKGVCAEPIQNKYEVVTKTIQRARKISVGVSRKMSSQTNDNNPGRKSSALRHQIDYGHDNNNFVIDIAESAEGNMSEIERNVKLRMQKRDELMR